MRRQPSQCDSLYKERWLRALGSDDDDGDDDADLDYYCAMWPVTVAVDGIEGAAVADADAAQRDVNLILDGKITVCVLAVMTERKRGSCDEVVH